MTHRDLSYCLPNIYQCVPTVLLLRNTSLSKSRRVLMSPASLLKDISQPLTHVSLCPTPDDEIYQPTAQQAACCQGYPRNLDYFPEPHQMSTPFPTSGNQVLASLSLLPLDPLICSQGFNNPMHADHSNVSSDVLPEPLRRSALAIRNSGEDSEQARLFHAPQRPPRVTTPPVHLISSRRLPTL